MTYTPEDFERSLRDFTRCEDYWNHGCEREPFKDTRIAIRFAILFTQHLLSEPTEEMIDAGRDISRSGWSYSDAIIFKAMRDQAVKEVTEKMETTNDR